MRLQQKAIIDLKPQIATLRTQMQSQLSAAAAKEKIGLALKQDYVGLQAVQLDDNVLTVVATFDGAADLIVNEIPLDQLK